jgi:hypothetical protein
VGEILHWVKEEGGHITSVDRATREEGTLRLGTHFSYWDSKASREELLLYQVPLY